MNFSRLWLQIGKTSAFIGPFITSAIITDSGGNNNMPFTFLFALWVVSHYLYRV